MICRLTSFQVPFRGGSFLIGEVDFHSFDRSCFSEVDDEMVGVSFGSFADVGQPTFVAITIDAPRGAANGFGRLTVSGGGDDFPFGGSGAEGFGIDGA